MCVWELKGIEQAEYARFTKHRRYIIKSTLHGIIQAALFLKSMKFLCEKALNSALFGVKPKFKLKLASRCFLHAIRLGQLLSCAGYYVFYGNNINLFLTMTLSILVNQFIVSKVINIFSNIGPKRFSVSMSFQMS